MSGLAQDLRYGVRILTKTGGLSSVAVLTLALGVGASTAVFSVVDAVLLKPLPYPDADRIVLPWMIAPAGLNLGFSEFPWGRVQFQEFARETKTFDAFGAFESGSLNLSGWGDAERLDTLRASAGFFRALGVLPSLGRTFTRSEDQVGHEREVILSDKLWRERFGADAGILGRVLELNGQPYTVIGVMPSGFAFPRANEMPSSFDFAREPQVWVPLALPPGPLRRGEPQEIAVVGRLKRNVTAGQAQAELNIYMERLQQQYPKWKGWFDCRVTPLARQVAGDTRRPLLLMLAAVGVVLLIACSNVASLLLARAVMRRREFTLRAALGAGRKRLVRQLLTESLLLAAAGGAAGIAIGEASIRFVKVFGPAKIPRLHEMGLDPRVFGFALGVTFLGGMLFGLAPALGATRDDLVSSLKEAGQRTGGSAAAPKIRNGLVVAQVALAFVLVVAAGLLTRTFFRLLSVDAGFRAQRVLTFELSLARSKYSSNDRIVAFYRNGLERLRSIAAVESVGMAEVLPMGGAGESTVVRVPDHPTANPQETPYANYTIVSPGYFSAVGTPMLRGRDFAETDSSDSLPVAIINKAMAQKFWPHTNAVGKQVGIPIRADNMTIVGVVANMKHLALREEPGPEMYVPYTQKPWPSMLRMQVALRTKADPVAMAGSVRQAIHSLDAELPVTNVATPRTFIDNAMTQPRFSTLVLALFGAVALLLASVGLYGLISYSVVQRTREIGTRIALGAQRGDVFRMIVGQGARLAGLGIGIGLIAALGVVQMMASFLYGVPATDAVTFIAVPLLLAAVGLLACYVPARRAMRVDPIVALRYE